MRGLAAARHEHGAARRDRHGSRAEHLPHGAGDDAIRGQLREGRDHVDDDTGLGGRRGPPGGCVQRRVAERRDRIQVELAPLARAAPRPVERDARDSQCTVGGDPETRAPDGRCCVQHAAAHHHPGRLAGVRREEIAVHADHGRRRAERLLHVGQLLGRHHRAVREHRGQRVERAVGTRSGDDVEHDRAVWRELHLMLIRHARHQQGLRRDLRRRPAGRPGRQRGDSGERGGDEQLAEHDPCPG